MKLLCPYCKEMPLIKITLFKKGEVIIIINCKCGKKFHDISTFIYDYTDIIIKDENKSPIILFSEHNQKVLYFCETCFINIYNEIISVHDGHKLIKIDENKIISESEYDTISNNIKLAKDKIKVYLPQMRDMLLRNSKNEKERIEILNIVESTIYYNNLILECLYLLYNIYDINKRKNTLTYQMIYNLKENSDYNLNKYKLDINTIKKERFISYLKSCLIICCNPYINKVYQNLYKKKEELLKLIYSLKPLGEISEDKTELELEEIMKSNSCFYFGEKSTINHLAHGRGILVSANSSHYLGYFKDDYFQEGLGKSVNSEGNIYFGQFKKGIANGFGRYITKTGNKFEGEWVDNKLNGFGLITMKKGEQYYIGDLKKGNFWGIGVFNTKNNLKYEGEFIDGKMDGIGYIDYKNKKEYKGEFKEGNKNGYGIMTWHSGEKYEGEWKDDTFKFGQYQWNNGNLFFGNYKNDTITGLGTFYNSALGSIETGIWKNGKREQIEKKDYIPSTRYLSFI